VRATLGAVLAGGASSRMGTDKASVLFPGVYPMAVEIAALLEPLADAVVLVRRAPSDEVWIARDGAALAVISDGEGETPHPLWGVAAALAHAGRGSVLFAPCDTPWLRSADLSALLAAANERGAVAMDASGRRSPLVAVYPASRAEEARVAAREGRSASHFAEGCARVLLPDASLANLNAPEALRRSL